MISSALVLSRVARQLTSTTWPARKPPGRERISISSQSPKIYDRSTLRATPEKTSAIMRVTARPMTAATTLEPATRPEMGAFRTKPKIAMAMVRMITEVIIFSSSFGGG